MSSHVVDASALLALLRREAGAEVVAAALAGGAAISAVNLSEVVAKLSEAGVVEEEVRTILDSLSLEVVDFDANHAYHAGLLRRLTRHAGLSLGDRACLALAQRLGLPALTADRAWGDLQLGIAIQLIC